MALSIVLAISFRLGITRPDAYLELSFVGLVVGLVKKGVDFDLDVIVLYRWLDTIPA